MKRREFAKRALTAAVIVPAALRSTLQEKEAPKTESKLKLSPAQEEAVKKATENRERQLNQMRSRVLPYDLEPAFVFAAKPRERKKR
jgi:hypothetical protein